MYSDCVPQAVLHDDFALGLRMVGWQTGLTTTAFQLHERETKQRERAREREGREGVSEGERERETEREREREKKKRERGMEKDRI